jgi:outer membrane lipoprotein SlyB
MMMRIASRCAVLTSLSIFLVGCETVAPTTPVYSAGQTGQVMSQKTGIVLSVEEVIIEGVQNTQGTGSRIGSAAGIGAVLGSPSTVIGAIGGIVGEKAGGKFDNKIGDKITVLTDDGKTISVVQVRDAQPIMPGERVVVESGRGYTNKGGGNTRVVREAPKPDGNYIGEKPKPKMVW